jgi:hypothetical protein
MIAMDSEVEHWANPWPGEFLLDSQWGYDEVGLAADIAREINPSWPLIAGGAFGGDTVRAEKALTALGEYRANLEVS